jgi:hypothetical protein
MRENRRPKPAAADIEEREGQAESEDPDGAERPLVQVVKEPYQQGQADCD